MYIELKHLRTVQAIHQEGGLARAADRLHMTQSALSHQVKALEGQVGMDLFVRRTKPLKLSAAGQRLLRLADRVLAEVAATEEEFRALRDGKSGRLHITLECHACYDWLLPVLEEFRHAWPEVDVDIRPGLSFDALPALEREEVDLVISSDPVDLPEVGFQPLFDYAPVCVVASANPLAQKDYIEAADLADQMLFHYPVERGRLDVYKTLLAPAGVEPRATRGVELTAVILMLVGANRGVTVLPDWVVRSVEAHPDYAVRPLTAQGVTRRMYAATRSADASQPYVAHFLRLARSVPVRLQRDGAAHRA